MLCSVFDKGRNILELYKWVHFCICAYGTHAHISCIRKSIWIKGNQANPMRSHFISFERAYFFAHNALGFTVGFYSLLRTEMELHNNVHLTYFYGAELLCLVPSTRFSFHHFFSVFILHLYSCCQFSAISSSTSELRSCSLSPSLDFSLFVCIFCCLNHNFAAIVFVFTAGYADVAVARFIIIVVIHSFFLVIFN